MRTVRLSGHGRPLPRLGTISKLVGFQCPSWVRGTATSDATRNDLSNVALQNVRYRQRSHVIFDDDTSAANHLQVRGRIADSSRRLLCQLPHARRLFGIRHHRFENI